MFQHKGVSLSKGAFEEPQCRCSHDLLAPNQNSADKPSLTKLGSKRQGNRFILLAIRRQRELHPVPRFNIQHPTSPHVDCSSSGDWIGHVTEKFRAQLVIQSRLLLSTLVHQPLSFFIASISSREGEKIYMDFPVLEQGTVFSPCHSLLARLSR